MLKEKRTLDKKKIEEGFHLLGLSCETKTPRKTPCYEEASMFKVVDFYLSDNSKAGKVNA